MAAHCLCMPLPVTDRLQHEATHLQDALQRRRFGEWAAALLEYHVLLHQESEFSNPFFFSVFLFAG